MEGLRRHQERQPETGNAPLRAARAANLVNAHETVKRLKAEVRQLDRKLSAGLAAQIELRDEKLLRQLYETGGYEVERLLTQNADLIREVTQLRETVRCLEDDHDLVIERTAYVNSPVNRLTSQASDSENELTSGAERLLRLRYPNATYLQAGLTGAKCGRAVRTPVSVRKCPLEPPGTQSWPARWSDEVAVRPWR